VIKQHDGPRYQTLLKKRWVDFLSRKDVVGGRLYWGTANETRCGEIQNVIDLGEEIRWVFEWCAQQLVSGLVYVKQTSLEMPKVRIREQGAGKPIQLGGCTFYPRGLDKLSKSEILLSTEMPEVFRPSDTAPERPRLLGISSTQGPPPHASKVTVAKSLPQISGKRPKQTPKEKPPTLFEAAGQSWEERRRPR
jgi:hypothetical protein